MGFRIVKINHRCKLETQLNYLVCRQEKETRILLDEIAILIVESQQVCLTSALMKDLMDHKVRIIFCDEQHNPMGEVSPYSGCFDSPDKIQKQVRWSEDKKGEVWRKIVRLKIENQAKVLKKKGKEEASNRLYQFRDEVEPDDPGNREGLAAKMYFSSLFSDSFDRRDKSLPENTYLNYGYSILLSAVNREIAIFGYLSSWGIHHRGTQNCFNLGCDLMEPFRPLVDIVLLEHELTEDNYKRVLLERFSENILFDTKAMVFENAIHEYVLRVLNCLKEDSLTSFPIVTFLE